jgi:pimeloyl-ACP methyl ester carboxylesterase
MRRRWGLVAVAWMVAGMSVPARGQEKTEMDTSATSGRIAVNGVQLHYEIHGAGKPLVMLHGGVNPADMFGAPLKAMAEAHQVIAVHLRGHGLSSDGDAPWSSELMADDVDVLLGTLGIGSADVMGYSLGGGVALQLAIRHPERVGKLVMVSASIKTSGNYPEVEEAFKAMGAQAGAIGAYLATTPIGEMYPDVDWEKLMRRTGEMAAAPFDWSEGVKALDVPTLVIFADADMMYPEHISEIYRLLGGGTRDAGVDGSLRPTQNQLAIIPGTTHYDLISKGVGPVTGFAKAFLAD